MPEAGSYVTNKDAIEEGIDDAVDLFVGLAACGQAKEAIRLLEDSPSADLLEPLIVGLRLYAGEDVKRAAEIIEVAKDVVKRIEERRKELESRPRA